MYLFKHENCSAAISDFQSVVQMLNNEYLIFALQVLILNGFSNLLALF